MQFVPFEDCINSLMKGEASYEVQGTPIELETVLPDLSCVKQIRTDKLSKEIKLGEVRYSFYFPKFLNQASDDGYFVVCNFGEISISFFIPYLFSHYRYCFYSDSINPG